MSALDNMEQVVVRAMQLVIVNSSQSINKITIDCVFT